MLTGQPESGKSLLLLGFAVILASTMDWSFVLSRRQPNASCGPTHPAPWRCWPTEPARPQVFLDALPQCDLEVPQLRDGPLPPIVTWVVEAILAGLSENGRRLYGERSLALLRPGRGAITASARPAQRPLAKPQGRSRDQKAQWTAMTARLSRSRTSHAHAVPSVSNVVLVERSPPIWPQVMNQVAAPSAGKCPAHGLTPP